LKRIGTQAHIFGKPAKQFTLSLEFGNDHAKLGDGKTMEGMVLADGRNPNLNSG